jgi:hypothetical protein
MFGQTKVGWQLAQREIQAPAISFSRAHDAGPEWNPPRNRNIGFIRQHAAIRRGGGLKSAFRGQGDAPVLVSMLSLRFTGCG